MSERMDDRELEATLSQIGRDLEYPRRDLWPAVRSKIEARTRSRTFGLFAFPRSPLVPVAATVAVLVVIALALTPELAARAAEVLGLRGIQIFRVSETPTPAPSAQPTLLLFTGARASSIADATTKVGFSIQTPAALGDPDAIYVDSSPARVTLVYESRPGIPPSRELGLSALVVEVRGAVDQNVMAKVVGPGTTIEPVSVDGAKGFWLAGTPHQFFYRDASGGFQQETLRLAGNTLLWERDGTVYRLEAPVSKEEALRIATSFR